ncbi:hypothetical protein HGRIS_011365 [Hohenbuehelia grisea]|uniref:Heme peroxidase n=1 Tax=Hohenbuehelia grisea TaxID=104357 RepID=A0ABR3JWL0_9AGAR
MAQVSASQILTLGADSVHLSKRPLPTAPDGYYDWQVSGDPVDKREGHSGLTNFINRFDTFKAKGGFKTPDPKLLGAFADTLLNPEAVDDRQGAFAAGLGIMARLDPSTDVAKSMNNKIISTLYNTVPHPPAAYLGPNHMFRQADGGGNSLQDPDCGRAGRPYARSVQGKAGLPRTSLPDPGIVFDTILKRKHQEIHSGGMSSLIFAFASIVTHSLFRTDQRDWTMNNASSYLDLSPVYGDNQAAQDKVRDKDAGRGLLYPDTFSEERLLFLPAATSVLLVIFSRNHNYIAKKLLKINERRRWSDPPPSDPLARAQQDEEIFQTARLINGGHFMAMIMGDYVAGFLGSSEGCNWNMNAFDQIKTKELEVPRGQGNHVSVEFNILYRWHATTSEADEKWTNGIFDQAFGGKAYDELSLKDLATIGKIFEDVPKDPSKRTFAGLKRGSDGRFSDDDLANILQTATSHPAGAFRGRGTPPVLRLVEIMGMEQARRWGVCTMNEFRKYLGLKEFESFEDWNPDPVIAEGARQLYGHIDNLELYTGLQAESTMPLTDGSRFACGYTTTRAVLGDAIALVRGDRFYTTDFTPFNLTTWGFNDCQRSMDNGAFGAQLPKLLMRALPRHYPWNSVYSLFPFFTPEHMKESLTTQQIADKYTFEYPKPQPVPVILNNFTAIKHAWSDPARFKTIYEKYGYGSILMFDDVKQHERDRAYVLHALFPDKTSLDQYALWFREETAAKIQEKTRKLDGVPGLYVDIVKDVINMVACKFAAEKLCGISLKTKEHPSGVYTEKEIFDMLITLFTVTFLTFDEPETSFALHSAAVQAGTIIGAATAKSLMAAAPSTVPNAIGRVVAKAASYIWPPSKKPCYPFLSDVASTGRPLDELLGNILGVAVGSSTNFSQAAAHIVDFYLDDARSKERAEITNLARKTDAASAELLQGYVREAMRLNPQFPGLWRDVAVDSEIPQGDGLPSIKVKAGDRLWASFRNAHLNPKEFPNPTEVNPRRPKALYNLNGTGFHNCPGTTYAQQTIAEIVRVIFTLKNLRRAPGDMGKLQGFTEVIHDTETNFYVNRDGTVGAWPGSLMLVYDA